MKQTIKANFKQATVKGGVAALQFEVLTDAEGAFDIVRQSGHRVFLTVETEQQELDFTEREALPAAYEVDPDTGEIIDIQEGL